MTHLRHIAALYALVSAGAAAAVSADLLALTTATQALAGLGLALGSGVALASMSPSLQVFGPAVLRGQHPEAVALTFDDGPDPLSTAHLLDVLDAAGAQGTFFVLADRVAAYPELARRIARDHEIALHGAEHSARLTWISPEQGAAELRAALDVLQRTTGVRPRYFRPPFGAVSPNLARALELVELDLIWCSVRARDGLWGTDARVRARCAGAVAGDIVLLHEGDRPAMSCLEAVLDDLALRGLTSARVSELLSTPSGQSAVTA